MGTEYKREQVKRDSAANWTSNNPTLLAGELGWESDTDSLKFGDGATAWTSLLYHDGGTKGYQEKCNFPDSSCQVAELTNTVTITTSYQYGNVDLVKMKAGGTVGAGLLVQGSTIGKKLKSAKASGTTLTGSGAVWVAVYEEARDAIKYKNQTCSVQAKVIHDVGSNVNYYIYVNKANSSDNFSAVTNIATSSAIVVATGTETTIVLEGISMGDCSNGIQLEIKSDCGAVTTKNFEFTDFQINTGPKIKRFVTQDYSEAVKQARRLVKFLIGNCATVSFNGGANWGGELFFGADEMRTAPSLNLTYLGTYHNTTGAAASNKWTTYRYQVGDNLTWATPPSTINADLTLARRIHFYYGGTTPSIAGAFGEPYGLYLGVGSYIIPDARF